MKRYGYIATAILFVALGVGLFVRILPEEPVYQGRPISAWIDQLTGGVGSSAGAVSSHVLPKLLEQKPGEEIVPYLRVTLHRGTSLKDRAYAKIYYKLPAFLLKKLPPPNPARDAELRYRAGLILYYVGPQGKKALPDLVAALKDPDPEVRRVSATVLGSFGTDAASAAPDLNAALIDPSADIRRAALKALASVESPATTVPACAHMLQDADEGVRTDAAQILRDVGPRARTAVRELSLALGDQNDDVFRFAAMALGRIGPEAKEALPALRQALRENRAYSETTIRWALRQIQPESVTNGVANR